MRRDGAGAGETNVRDSHDHRVAGGQAHAHPRLPRHRGRRNGASCCNDRGTEAGELRSYEIQLPKCQSFTRVWRNAAEQAHAHASADDGNPAPRDAAAGLLSRGRYADRQMAPTARAIAVGARARSGEQNYNGGRSDGECGHRPTGHARSIPRPTVHLPDRQRRPPRRAARYHFSDPVAASNVMRRSPARWHASACVRCGAGARHAWAKGSHGPSREKDG